MRPEDAINARVSAIRQQNDGLLTTARELGMRPDAPFIFMCECGDPFCTDSIKVSIAECTIRRRERGSLLFPGHGVRRADGVNQAA